MASHLDTVLRIQRMTRRQRLESAMVVTSGHEYLTDLLRQVDAALFRLDTGTFGLCETCHEPIEGDRLAADPLVRFCMEHLTPPQQRALEEDLELWPPASNRVCSRRTTWFTVAGGAPTTMSRPAR